MSIYFGMLFVLSFMTLIFFGPEWFESLHKGTRVYKKVSRQHRRSWTRAHQ